MTFPAFQTILVLRRLRVEMANAQGGALTYGFPALSAFFGFADALERSGALGTTHVTGVGVLSHDYCLHTAKAPYLAATHRHGVADTRGACTPSDPRTFGMHGNVSEITGTFTLSILLALDAAPPPVVDDADPAAAVADWLAGARLAGGVIQPDSRPARVRKRGAKAIPPRVSFADLGTAYDTRDKHFQRALGRCSGGRALVSARSVLRASANDGTRFADSFDAWLAFSSFDKDKPVVKHDGYLCPLAVGYAAVGPLCAPGSVRGARDPALPLQQVEAVYSLGEWRSARGMRTPADFFWYRGGSPDNGTYLFVNDFKQELPHG